MADLLQFAFKFNSARPRDFSLTKLSSSSGRDILPCMIVGESCDVKSSLLFLTAVTTASGLGGKVLYLTPTPIQRLPGQLQDSLASLNADSLKKIKFMYPRSQEELLQVVGRLHESVHQAATSPALLIVDGLEHYLQREADGGPQREDLSAAAHVSALLSDTAAFLTRKLEERGGAYAPCRVIVSFNTGPGGQGTRATAAPDPVLLVLDRYFSVRCTLEKDGSANAPGPAGEPGNAWHIYFSGAGIAADSNHGDPVLGHQWHLAIHPNGAMEFSCTCSESCVS